MQCDFEDGRVRKFIRDYTHYAPPKTTSYAYMHKIHWHPHLHSYIHILLNVHIFIPNFMCMISF